MSSAIVLGAGMVGSVLADDLASTSGMSIAIADRSNDNLEAARARCGDSLETIQADLSDQDTVARLVEPHDMVFGALTGHLGMATLETVIEVGRNFCDISFMPEDAMDLDQKARDKGVTAVVDCGVAPGMSNLLAGWAAHKLDECTNIEILVGGLPVKRSWPYEYKAGFSPADVLEEYTRPARLVEHGQVVTREALSEPELLEFEGIGTLESFNTDGLRSLAYTLDVPFMKEKTLRYPGHIELMRVFRETGFFSTEPIEIDGVSIRPLDVISKLLFPMWTYEELEEDLTVMTVVAEGTYQDEPTRLTWNLLDYYDTESRATSMSRTTAFPCSIVGQMIASGELDMPGVIPPEKLAPVDDLLDVVLQRLAERNIRYDATVETRDD